MERARISAPTTLPADYSAIADKGATRRESLGLAIEQSNTIWRALDRAAENLLADAPFTGKNARQRERLVALVAAATAAVRRSTRRPSDGGASDVTVVDRSVLDLLRTEFLRELHAETNIDGRQLVRVLQGFDTVTAKQAPPNKSLSNFGLEALVEVAHDMRSPLTSILFLVDAIRTGKSGSVSPIQERQLGLIYGAALGLSTLASDLVDLVRGGGGLVEGPAAPFSIAEVVCGVRDLVTPIAEEKGLRLECAPPATDGRVGYASAVSRVLLNLTTNAVKFTETGSVQIDCTEITTTRVRFSVTDSGTGLPQEVRRSLFSPFTLSRGRMRFSNSGLGLSICRSLLRSLDSELHMQTSSGHGSCFSFELELPPADLT